MPSQKLTFPSVFLPFIHFVLLSCTSFWLQTTVSTPAPVDPMINEGGGRGDPLGHSPVAVTFA